MEQQTGSTADAQFFSRYGRQDKMMGRAMKVLILAVAAVPEIAFAQATGGGGDPLGPLTALLKTMVTVLIFQWGYYIGIGSLAVLGIRYKTGHVSFNQLLGWGFGISIVFFAPNIVGQLRGAAPQIS